MPKSGNQKSEEIKRKQFKDQQNKKRQVLGPPTVTEKVDMILVQEANNREYKPNDGKTYRKATDEYKRYEAKVLKIKRKDHVWVVEQIKCPICGAPIDWNRKVDGFLCQNDCGFKIFDYQYTDTRTMIVASGGVVNTVRLDYDVTAIGTKTKEKIELCKYMRKRQKMRYQYRCGITVRKKQKQCGETFTSIHDLRKHQRKQHQFTPRETFLAKYNETYFEAQAKRFIIVPMKHGFVDLPTILYIPTRDIYALLNIREKMYVGENGENIYLIVPGTVNERKNMLRPTEKNTLQQFGILPEDRIRTISRGHCAECGAPIRVTADGKKAYCRRMQKCPEYKRNERSPRIKELIISQRKQKKTSEKQKKNERFSSVKQKKKRKKTDATKRIIDFSKKRLAKEFRWKDEKEEHDYAMINKKGRTVIISKPTEKAKTKEIVISNVDEKKDVRPTTKIKCPKCGHDKAYWTLRQMRGSDEPESRFYECKKCGHKWRED